MIDVAAPGSDILSTVSYNSFNPTIYSAEQREQLCASYQDFDDALTEGEFGSISTSIPAESGIVAGPDADNQYFGLSGNSYSFVFPEGNKSGKKYYMAIPYSIADDSKNYSISFMSNNFDAEYSVYDLPADTKIDSSTIAKVIEDNESIAGLMSDKGDDWVHVFIDYDIELISEFTKRLRTEYSCLSLLAIVIIPGLRLTTWLYQSRMLMLMNSESTIFTAAHLWLHPMCPAQYPLFVRH